MIGDLHGTPEYRAHLVGVLTGRAVAAGLTARGVSRVTPGGRGEERELGIRWDLNG